MLWAQSRVCSRCQARVFPGLGREKLWLQPETALLRVLKWKWTPVVPAGIHFMLDRALLFYVVGFWHPVFYVTQSGGALDQLMEIGPPLADFLFQPFSLRDLGVLCSPPPG